MKEEHLKAIAAGLDLDYDELMARVMRFSSRPKYEPMVLKEEMTPADLAFVDSHRDFFPELLSIQAQSRLYPQNGMLAHVIGYTGEISEEELDDPEFAKYNPGQVIGKFGIERQYNDWLTGVDGQRQVMVDNRGSRSARCWPPSRPFPARICSSPSISICSRWRNSPWTAGCRKLGVDHKNGAVVALDPNNGEVLAMVSRPTFDPEPVRRPHQG